MRLALAAIAVGTLFGCAHGGSSGAKLSGRIAIPDDVTLSPNAFCESLQPTATLAGIKVGSRAAIETDAKECRYEVGELPANTDLSLSLVPTVELLSCDRGRLVVLTPANIPVKLSAGESRSVDFQPHCGE